jgi:predicted nucleic acid-binding protein
MQLVCDASPLIVLAKAGLLSLLPGLAQAVEIPAAVRDETLAGPEDDPMRVALDVSAWLRVVQLPTPISPLTRQRLGAGETEVIEWARLHPGRTVVLDDRFARQTARTLGLAATGTLGLVALASLRGLLPSFRAAATRLVESGLYLDAELVDRLARQLDRKE